MNKVDYKNISQLISSLSKYRQMQRLFISSAMLAQRRPLSGTLQRWA